MKDILIILLVFISLIGCSKTAIMKEETLSSAPQYLEEVSTFTTDEDAVDEELKKLQSIRPGRYRIGLGDKFSFYVYNEQDMTTKEIIVKPDGTISIKMIGEVYVKGLTIPEASKKIEKLLSKYILHPKISLLPYEIKSSTVTILGKVNYPGSYPIERNMRILHAVAKAGGLSVGLFQNNSVEMADLERSYIVRRGRILPINFLKLMRKGEMKYNIPLVDGDYIYIPSAINKEIYVLGEVNSPGHYAYREGMTLLQIISFAEGLKPTAKWDIFVVRGGLNHPRIFKADAKAMLKAEIRDFPLYPNDIVYVPNSFIGDWNNVMREIIPTLQVLQGGWIVREFIRDNR